MDLAIAVLVSLAFAVLRFVLPSHGLSAQDIFKDFAHLWVGVLVGYAYAKDNGYFWLLVAFLTIAEVTAAIIK